MGSTGVTQNVTVGVDPAAMGALVKMLTAELPNLPLDTTFRAAVQEALSEVQRETQQPDPETTRVAAAFGRVVDYIVDTGKPVVTAAFMLAASRIGLPPA